MKDRNYREELISRAISVVANDGFDKTTTKAIVKGTDISESYIYRFFADKEDLFRQMFNALDNELVAKATQHITVMYVEEMDFETKCWAFYSAIWKFLLSNREKCLAFVRYYYSPYYKKHSVADHKKRYAPLVKKFGEAFRPEANTWMLLKHILNVMLDFAVRIYDGELADNDDTAKHVFVLVYSSISPYRRLAD